MGREIEIEIGPDGTVKATIKGVKGPRCKEYAGMLSELLAAEASFTPSSEYYEDDCDVTLDIRGRYES